MYDTASTILNNEASPIDKLSNASSVNVYPYSSFEVVNSSPNVLKDDASPSDHTQFYLMKVESAEDNATRSPSQESTNHSFRWPWWRVLTLGQVISVLLTSTGVFTQLLSEKGYNVPTLQSVLVYLLLILYFIPLYNSRKNHLVTQINENAVSFSEHSSASGGAAVGSWLNLLKPRYTKFYWYSLVALCDIEGNYFVVKAYQFTTIASVQLLDSFVVLCVLVLAWFFLNVRYNRGQYLGAFLCIVGVTLCVVSDVVANPEKKKGGGSSISDKVIGDIFVLVSCAAYACSNVAQDYMIKKNEQSVMQSLSTQISSSNMDEESKIGVSYSDKEESKKKMANEEVMAISESVPILVNTNPDNQSRKLSEKSRNLAYEQVADQRWEFLAFLGLNGTILSLIQIAILERDEIRKAPFDDYYVGLYLFGFIACLFFVYSTVPVLLLRGDSVIMNLSFLTSDFFGLIAAVAIFHNRIHGLYFLAFVMCVLGLFVYNIAQAQVPLLSIFGCDSQAGSEDFGNSEADGEPALKEEEIEGSLKTCIGTVDSQGRSTASV